MDTSKTSFTTKVQQYADTQDLFIEIPHYILQNLDWEEERWFLAWSIKNNQIILTKVKDSGSDEEERGEARLLTQSTTTTSTRSTKQQKQTGKTSGTRQKKKRHLGLSIPGVKILIFSHIICSPGDLNHEVNVIRISHGFNV